MIKIYICLSSVVSAFLVLSWFIQYQSHVCLLSFCPCCSSLYRFMLARSILASHHLPANPILYRLIKFYTALPNPLMNGQVFYWPIQVGICFSSLVLGFSVSDACLLVEILPILLIPMQILCWLGLFLLLVIY